MKYIYHSLDYTTKQGMSCLLKEKCFFVLFVFCYVFVVVVKL